MAILNKNSIQQLIMKGQLKKAAQGIMALVKEKDEDLYNSMIMQMSRINSLERDINSGVISDDNARINKAKITHALNSFAGDLKDDWQILVDDEIDDDPIIPKPNKVDQKTKILFLGVNPKGTDRLRIDEEVKKIDQGLRLSKYRDEFELKTKLAVTVTDLRRYLLDDCPNILHFSGHGEGEEGLIFEDEQGEPHLVDGSALVGLFGLFPDIECIVLNACYSLSQAEAIVEQIPFVIGMNKKMPDDAAIEFAVAFYDALGAGRDVDFAYRLGRSAIEMKGIKGENIPILLKTK